MDSLEYHVVVILPPLDIRLLRVELLPASAPGASAAACLTVTRELSIMGVGAQLTVRSLAPSTATSTSEAQQTRQRGMVQLTACD